MECGGKEEKAMKRAILLAASTFVLGTALAFAQSEGEKADPHKVTTDAAGKKHE